MIHVVKCILLRVHKSYLVHLVHSALSPQSVCLSLVWVTALSPLCPLTLSKESYYTRAQPSHVFISSHSPPVCPPLSPAHISSVVLPLFIALFLSLWLLESTGIQGTGHTPRTPSSTTDMSDSETPAAPAEAPVPAACTGIKANLDKW